MTGQEQSERSQEQEHPREEMSGWHEEVSGGRTERIPPGEDDDDDGNDDKLTANERNTKRTRTKQISTRLPERNRQTLRGSTLP